MAGLLEMSKQKTPPKRILERGGGVIRGWGNMCGGGF